MSHRIAIIVLTLLGAASTTAAEVRLRSSAVCATSVVRVADVAEIFAGEARIAAALAEIPLCPAPAAESQRTFSQNDVRRLLELSGVESETALVTGSESVTVTTESSIRSGSLPRQPLIASGVRQATFETEADSIRKPKNQFGSKPPAPIRSDAKPSASPPLVARGALLTVNARTAGVRITTSGKALEQGAAGETIGVELADTKQRVQGRVIGPQLVEVTAGAGNE
jgi:flagella basal body P-ring formation protein FlgA